MNTFHRSFSNKQPAMQSEGTSFLGSTFAHCEVCHVIRITKSGDAKVFLYLTSGPQEIVNDNGGQQIQKYVKIWFRSSEI